jgi:hypothetical protein
VHLIQHKPLNENLVYFERKDRDTDKTASKNASCRSHTDVQFVSPCFHSHQSSCRQQKKKIVGFIIVVVVGGKRRRFKVRLAAAELCASSPSSPLARAPLVLVC